MPISGGGVGYCEGRFPPSISENETLSTVHTDELVVTTVAAVVGAAVVVTVLVTGRFLKVVLRAPATQQ